MEINLKMPRHCMKSLLTKYERKEKLYSNQNKNLSKGHKGNGTIIQKNQGMTL